MKKQILPHRARFGVATRFLTPLRSVISAAFGQRGARKNFNRCLSVCLNGAMDLNADPIRVNPERVLISNGSLSGVGAPKVMLEGHLLSVTFDSASRLSGFPDDLVWLCAYAPELGVVDVNQRLFVCENGRVELPLIKLLRGVPMLVYLYVSNRNKTAYSRSQFLGEIGKEVDDVAG